MIAVRAPNGQRVPATDPKPSERGFSAALRQSTVGKQVLYTFAGWVDPKTAAPGTVFGKRGTL